MSAPFISFPSLSFLLLIVLFFFFFGGFSFLGKSSRLSLWEEPEGRNLKYVRLIDHPAPLRSFLYSFPLSPQQMFLLQLTVIHLRFRKSAPYLGETHCSPEQEARS